MVCPALPRAEGQFVKSEHPELVAHIECRASALRTQIAVLLLNDGRAAADGAGIVERLAEGIDAEDRKASRHTLLQANLEGVIDGLSAGLIQSEAADVRNAAHVAVELHETVGRSKNIEICALRASVGDVQNPTARQLLLQANIPNLNLRDRVIWIDRDGVGDYHRGRRRRLGRETIFKR